MKQASPSKQNTPNYAARTPAAAKVTSLAIAIAGGMSGASLMALYFVPAAYALMYRRRNKHQPRKKQLQQNHAEDYASKQRLLPLLLLRRAILRQRLRLTRFQNFVAASTSRSDILSVRLTALGLGNCA